LPPLVSLFSSRSSSNSRLARLCAWGKRPPGRAPWPWPPATEPRASSSPRSSSTFRLKLLQSVSLFFVVSSPTPVNQAQARSPSPPLYFNPRLSESSFPILETETPEQEVGEHESEPVADDAQFVKQGDPQPEPVFGYFYPVDGGTGEK
ncbi:unnamed protein product, partial [Urochloa humidicola]